MTLFWNSPLLFLAHRPFKSKHLWWKNAQLQCSLNFSKWFISPRHFRYFLRNLLLSDVGFIIAHVDLLKFPTVNFLYALSLTIATTSLNFQVFVSRYLCFCTKIVKCVGLFIPVVMAALFFSPEWIIIYHQMRAKCVIAIFDTTLKPISVVYWSDKASYQAANSTMSFLY